MTSVCQTCKHFCDLALTGKSFILPFQTLSRTDNHLCSLWSFIFASQGSFSRFSFLLNNINASYEMIS